MAVYTAIDDAGSFYNPILYTGTGSSNAITGVGFQPDLVWVKKRSATGNNVVTDAVRGEKQIITNSTGAQTSNSGEITSLDTDGFTVGTGGDVNLNTATFISWSWKAGTTTGIDTTGSTITPIGYSFNATSGFSIVEYTGNDTAGALLPHGLGVAPDMVIVKALGNANSWVVQHQTLGPTKYLYLDTTAGEASSTTRWNDTAPTAVNVVLGSGGNTNGSGSDSPFICYSFANKKGFSRMGSYTGNGNADGSFVYTGFRPALVITKRTDSTSSWDMTDSKRGYNDSNPFLRANGTYAEDTDGEQTLLSNGFKPETTNADSNASGGTYVYMAFAESPFVNAEGVPTNAR